MPIIKIEIIVDAPRERVFDLARSIDLHTETMSEHKEKAVAGKINGLVNIGETVTWEAVHFGVKQKLTSKITMFNRPVHFRDSMVKGAFARFDHDHFFEEAKSGTLMKDIFDYDPPLGILGNIADALFLEKYMTKILEDRNELIKKISESEDWQKFLSS
ncbi:MAG: SRPBCC family protein [Pyrinomonadaceae bacterium]